MHLLWSKGPYYLYETCSQKEYEKAKERFQTEGQYVPFSDFLYIKLKPLSHYSEISSGGLLKTYSLFEFDGYIDRSK